MIKKILVVDDSALMRRVLSDIIAIDKRFVQADAANDGLEAYDMIFSNPMKYDLIILDINMPKMNGIQLLEKLNEKNVKTPVIIVSSVAKEGAAETIRCLELGAFDFITKPDSYIETKSEKFLTKVLKYMCAATGVLYEAPSQEDTRSSAPVSGLSSARPSFRPESFGNEQIRKDAPSKETLRTEPDRPVPDRSSFSRAQAADSSGDKASSFGSSLSDGPMSYIRTVFERKPHVSVGANAVKLVAIACSTGGPKALQSVIPLLPANLAAPVVIVQHMPEGFTGSLAERLDEMSKVSVKEAVEGETLKRGTVYIAKGGSHLTVIQKGNELFCSSSDEPARNGLKPCADIMYESLKELNLDEIVCVVLTGMGSDGTRGIGALGMLQNIYVIAQDEATSTVYGMPRMVKEAGVTDEVVALGSVADAISKIVGTR